MYGCESWTTKKAEHQRIDALELWCWRTLESPLDSKEIKPVNSKGNQLWLFIERTDADAEAPVLWPPDANSQLIGKDPVDGKDWGQEEQGAVEDEMVGWCWEPPRETPPTTKVMWRRPDRQRGIRIRGAPWTCSSIYPKTRICLSYYFVPFTNPSDINRGLSPITFLWRKSNLGL